MNSLADNRWLDEFLGFLIHELLAVVLCWIVTLLYCRCGWNVPNVCPLVGIFVCNPARKPI